MDKLSIIVPIYNVAQYLTRCLDSIINQTYKNIEILLVNDGSTDDSGDIADDYAKKDSRIKVFHTPNNGLSAARNIGIRNFTGKYVGFVDSDDWIEPDMYEILYGVIKEKKVHIATAGFFTATETGSIPRINLSEIPCSIHTSEQMVEYVFRMDIYNAYHIMVVNRLYSAKIFDVHKCKFDESLMFGEDVEFIPKVMMIKGCKGVYINKPVYHYYQRPDSLCNINAINNKFDLLKATEITIGQLEKKNYNTFNAKKEHCYFASLIADIALSINDLESLQKAQVAMQQYYYEYEQYNSSNYPERVARVNKLIKNKIKGC